MLRHRRLTSSVRSAKPPKNAPTLLTNSGLGAEAGVGCDFCADPAPDVLVRVEVRAVGRQSDQAESQARCRQVGTQWVTTMRRTVVPHDDQRLGLVRPQLLQDDHRGLGVAVAL